MLYKSKRLLYLITVLVALLLVSCATPPKSPEDGGGVASLNVVNDEHLVGRGPSEKTEEENEPPVEGDPAEALTDNVDDSGITTTQPTQDVIRAGTFNAYILTSSRAREPNPVTELGGGQKWEASFQLMDYASINILAVQEVYVSEFKIITIPSDNTTPSTTITHVKETTSDHHLLNTQSRGKYAVIKGEPIYRYRQSWSATNATGTEQRKILNRKEYCPIIYDTTKLNCSENNNSDVGHGRNIHFVSCTTVNPSGLQFTYGCAHFSARESQTRDNIGGMGALVTGKKIIGGDFNSNAFGALSGEYQNINNLDRADDTRVPQEEGRFTKIHKKPDDSIAIRADPQWRVLDDLLWTSEMRTHYVRNSKRIIDFGHPITDQQWFQTYYGLSDHLPVIADFQTTTTTGPAHSTGGP